MRHPLSSTTKSARRVLPVALFVVLGIGTVVGIALAKDSLAAPTITGSPANPTNAQTASFTYTDSQAITKFQCSLDGSAFQDCGTTRPSSTAYPGPLSAASHT